MKRRLPAGTTRYGFVVEIEADYLEQALVPIEDPALAAIQCPAILADEIISNLQRLDGIGVVTVEQVKPVTR